MKMCCMRHSQSRKKSQTGLPLTQKEEILETSLLCLYVKYYISKVLELLPFVAW